MKKHWWNLKIFFSRTNGPISTNLGTKHSGWWGFKCSNEKTKIFYEVNIIFLLLIDVIIKSYVFIDLNFSKVSDVAHGHLVIFCQCVIWCSVKNQFYCFHIYLIFFSLLKVKEFPPSFTVFEFGETLSSRSASKSQLTSIVKAAAKGNVNVVKEMLKTDKEKVINSKGSF